MIETKQSLIFVSTSNIGTNTKKCLILLADRIIGPNLSPMKFFGLYHCKDQVPTNLKTFFAQL